MTDYGSMSHQQLYTFVQSGSVADVSERGHPQREPRQVRHPGDHDLHKTLNKIQSSWTGAAADQFSQQANSLVQQMRSTRRPPTTPTSG